MAVQLTEMAGQIVLYLDICPCVSVFLFLALHSVSWLLDGESISKNSDVELNNWSQSSRLIVSDSEDVMVLGDDAAHDALGV